jgi:hypothetical protein
MSFEENLRRKITLDRKAQALEAAIPAQKQPYGHINKQQVRDFLALTPFKPQSLRGLEIYALDSREVLVLDNELPLYRDVSPEEVAMRRNPEVKEMLKLSNVKKILTDTDILMAKGRATIKRIHDEMVQGLDLTFAPEDINGIAAAGRRALEMGRPVEMAEQLELLFELLGYQEMERMDGGLYYGQPEPEGWRDPVLEAEPETDLMLVRGVFNPEREEDMEELLKVASGARRADARGGEVFSFLAREILRPKAA